MKSQNKWAAAGIVVALFFSCHPARQVQQQDQDIQMLKAKWIADWVKDHPCPQLPAMNLDSLCGLNDFAFSVMDGDSIKKDTSASRCKPIVRRILVPYQDTRTVELLYDSLRAETERIAMLESRGETQGQDCNSRVNAMKGERDKWLWLFIAACAVIVGGLVWRVYSFFTGLKKIG